MRLTAIYEARARDARGACGCKDAVAARAAQPEPEPEPVVPMPMPTPVTPATGCKPWLKVERDEARYEACMKIAEAIGPIDTPGRAFEILSEALGSEDQEVFGALILDTHLQIRGLAETGRGEMSSVQAPIVPTMRIAVAEGAEAMIIFHCHPTLYTKPSDADIEVTRSFYKAASALNILLIDHMILGGKKGYYSFLESMPGALK
jgi:DNA repair protein RadC